MSDARSTPLRKEIPRLFRDLAGALPPGAASLKIVEDPEPGEGLTVSLIPSAPTAARITARVDDACDVTLCFGKGAVYEVPLRGKRFTDSPCLEEVRLLCLAVIDGLFTETVWFQGDEVVQARAEVRIGGKPIRQFWRQVFTNPFRRRRRERVSYTPYVT
jgi:hypothetical protein